jgi:hypothetical protein
MMTKSGHKHDDEDEDDDDDDDDDSDDENYTSKLQGKLKPNNET